MHGSLSKTLFVSDLDGTLLTTEKRLLDGQTAVLNDLIDRGLQFTIATARSVQAVSALLHGVHLHLPAITLGGSLLTRPNSGEHLTAKTLSEQTAAELLARFNDRGIWPFVAALDGNRDRAFHSHTRSAAAQWYVDEKRAYGDPRLCWYDRPPDVLGASILSMATFVEQSSLSDLIETMRQVEGVRAYSMPARRFPGWYEVTASNPEADKGKTLGVLWQEWNNGWDRIVVFGDDTNDLPLFERADFSIAVANAVPEVLAKADLVIQSNDAGAVVDYLASCFIGQ